MLRRLVLVLALFLSAPALAADNVGVVLMHGKWGGPDRLITSLAAKLADAGYLVDRPEMPWSKRREYDGDYDRAMADIDAAVARLKARGATRIVVGGQSFGANAAMGYAARRDGLTAILAVGPGHTPETLAPKLKDSLDKARAMAAEGRGEETANFEDLNVGAAKTISTKARIYLSYFDPEGPAVIPVNAANFRQPIPLLWVVGRQDHLMIGRGEAYAFAKAPPHPASKYLVVEADHMATPNVAAPDIVEWLNAVVR